MTNSQLLENAKISVNQLFSDTSVSLNKGIENLEEVISDCETYINALKADLENQE